MVMIVLNTSYIIGMLWLIICNAIGDFVHDIHFHHDYKGSQEDYFIPNFQLDQKEPMTRAIIATYFAFTSLSTVGFGDYHPRSNIERLIGAFILMFVVAIFSFIMGNFIMIIETLKNYNEDPDYGIELFKFFGTIKKFNKNQELDINLRNQFEEYFDYRWSHDKNSAFGSDDTHQFFPQLPQDLQNSIF